MCMPCGRVTITARVSRRNEYEGSGPRSKQTLQFGRYLQDVQEAPILHKLRIDVVQFCDTHCCCFPDIGVIILQQIAPPARKSADSIVFGRAGVVLSLSGFSRLTFNVRCNGSQRYSVILSTLMHPMVRTASALMRGLGSWESCKKNCKASMPIIVQKR